MTDFNQRLTAIGEKMKAVEQDMGASGVSFLVTQMPDTVGRLRCKFGQFKVSSKGESVNPIFYCVTEGEGTPTWGILFDSEACSEASRYANILGIVDPSTLVRHGWQTSTASILIDTYLLDGSRCPYDVRGILERVDAKAREQGVYAKSAVEYEFGIFHADQDLAQKGAYSQLTPWGDSLHNYSVLRSAEYQDFVREFISRMESIDIPVPSFTTEYGFGMYEISLAPAPALKAADDAVRAKLCLQELCTERGLVATFMARFQPVGKESACGAHQHVSLWQDDRPVTTYANGNLSEFAESFLAGMLQYLPETHLFFRPTINSYRRYEKSNWSPGERLKLFRETLGMSQREFAASLSFSGGTIGAIESGISKPSRNFLQRISDRYDINSDWLLNGHGEMRRPTAPGFTPSNPSEPRIMPPDYTQPGGGSFSIDGHNFGLIRRFDVSASAGSGLGYQADNVVDQIAFSRRWMAERGLTSDLSGIVIAKGVSMEPMIPDGAQMLVRFNVTMPYPPGVYIFRYKEELFVKHLTVLDVDPIQRPVRVLIWSQNLAIAPRVIEIDEEAEFKIIGQVVSVIADLD